MCVSTTKRLCISVTPSHLCKTINIWGSQQQEPNRSRSVGYFFKTRIEHHPVVVKSNHVESHSKIFEGPHPWSESSHYIAVVAICGAQKISKGFISIPRHGIDQKTSEICDLLWPEQLWRTESCEPERRIISPCATGRPKSTQYPPLYVRKRPVLMLIL